MNRRVPLEAASRIDIDLVRIIQNKKFFREMCFENSHFHISFVMERVCLKKIG